MHANEDLKNNIKCKIQMAVSVFDFLYFFSLSLCFVHDIVVVFVVSVVIAKSVLGMAYHQHFAIIKIKIKKKSVYLDWKNVWLVCVCAPVCAPVCGL